jgi:hypothetical protein
LRGRENLRLNIWQIYKKKDKKGAELFKGLVFHNSI